MDARFFDFWADVFKSAAQGQRQMDQALNWMNQGFKGYEEMAAAFRKAYGLEDVPKKSPEYANLWKKAAEAFQESMKGWQSFFEAKPSARELELIEKYEKLKEKAASQEETIKHLRMLLESKGSGEGDLQKGLQDLISKQQEQFSELIKGLGLIKDQSE